MANISTDTNRQNAVFATVPSIQGPRNTFPLIKQGKTTHQFDLLHPIWCKEILPGDTINFEFEFFARLQTQATDLFDDLMSDAHVWFGQNRLVQTNFARLFYDSQITGPTQDNSTLTTPSVDGAVQMDGSVIFEEKSLYDDLEYPTKTDLRATIGPDTLRHITNYKARHYHNIWNLNYRDENLQNAVHMDYDDGVDDYDDYKDLLKRGKRHDMPTSCLPFRQKGPAPVVPLVGTAQVVTNGQAITLDAPAAGLNEVQWRTITSSADTNLSGTASGVGNIFFGDQSGLQVSFSNALVGFYVNDARYTIAVQQLLEANARGGTRDVEALANIWNVDVPDVWLNRPEYLGGSTFSFDGHIVPQTSETGSTPQANLASFSQQKSKMRIMHSFKEPGYLFILLSHRSNQTYQNFLKKEDTRRTRWDWYNPFFANLGETAVRAYEVFMSGSIVDDNAIFGYQRYGYEYIYEMNSVTREMRSNATLSLDAKHTAYDFATNPMLTDAFIESDTSAINRNIVVDTDEVDPIQINYKISGSIARQIPLDSIPGLQRL